MLFRTDSNWCISLITSLSYRYVLFCIGVEIMISVIQMLDTKISSNMIFRYLRIQLIAIFHQSVVWRFNRYLNALIGNISFQDSCYDYGHILNVYCLNASDLSYIPIKFNMNATD